MDSLAVRIPASVAAHEAGLSLSHEQFRLLYARTAPQLRAYLVRILSGSAEADDILQESYLRLLRANNAPAYDPEHLKNYLFRIATNLARDELSRRGHEPLDDVDAAAAAEPLHTGEFGKFFGELAPRQRELLWLAYVERFTHQEIASIIGARAASIRPMLFRARQKLASILKKGGFAAS